MMKTASLLLLLFLVSSASSQTVAMDSIAKYENKTVTICERVQETFLSKGEKKVVYINFGKPYPNASFTVAIFESSLKYFSYNPVLHLKDKTICVTGIVKMYQGKPQITVKSPKQISIQE